MTDVDNRDRTVAHVAAPSRRPQATFRHDLAGTPAAAWDPVLARVPVLHHADLMSAGPSVVVVAPHPDDETLGAGGLIAALCAAGLDVTVVICTDGSAAELSPPIEPGRLAELRRIEVCEALDVLSGGRVAPLLLGLPDGRSHDAALGLAEQLAALLREADLVVGPWPGDGHVDHRACGLAVRAACPPHAALLEYPIWAWHWDDPMHTSLRNLVRVPMSHGARQRKRDALRRHVTQLSGDRPMLAGPVLEHFDGRSEAFVVRSWGALHRVDRSSPEFFDAMYRADPARDPWGFAEVAAERERLDHLASLVHELGRRRSAIELGCGNGQLTRRLAPMCDHLVAVDASAAAVDTAVRTIEHPGIDWRVARLPAGMSDDDEPYDLIVMAEIGYYFEPAALEALVAQLADRAAHDAALILSHWTGTSVDHRLSAEVVHATADLALRARHWQPTDRHRHGEHLVEVWARCS